MASSDTAGVLLFVHHYKLILHFVLLYLLLQILWFLVSKALALSIQLSIFLEVHHSVMHHMQLVEVFSYLASLSF